MTNLRPPTLNPSDMQDKNWLIENLQISLRRLHIQPSPTKHSTDLFCRALGQCRTSPQFLYVPLPLVRLGEVPHRVVSSHGVPGHGFLCEVAAWNIYLGVGLGSNMMIARDRAIVQALYLLSLGSLSLLPMVRRWGSSYFPVIGVATFLSGQNIHIPPFYTAPLLAGKGEAPVQQMEARHGSWEFTPSTAHFGPFVSGQSVSSLIIRRGGMEAKLDILKQSAEFSGVGVDMFAEKIEGKEEYVWTVFVEGEPVADAKGGKKAAKAEAAWEALKALSKVCTAISVEKKQVNKLAVLHKKDVRERASNIINEAEKGIASDNVGFQMLVKMGFSVGEGLGRDQTGISRPVEAFGQSAAIMDRGLLTTKEVEEIIKDYIKTDSVEDLVFSTNLVTREWRTIEEVTRKYKLGCNSLMFITDQNSRKVEFLVVSKRVLLEAVIEELERSKSGILYHHGMKFKLVSKKKQDRLEPLLRFQELRKNANFPTELVNLNERLKSKNQKRKEKVEVKKEEKAVKEDKMTFKSVDYEYRVDDVPKLHSKKRAEIPKSTVDVGGNRIPGVEQNLGLIDHGVLRIIGARPKGVFVTWAERQYQKICQRTLPEDWCEQLVGRGKIRLSLDGQIVYPGSGEQDEDVKPGEGSEMQKSGGKEIIEQKNVDLSNVSSHDSLETTASLTKASLVKTEDPQKNPCWPVGPNKHKQVLTNSRFKTSDNLELATTEYKTDELNKDLLEIVGDSKEGVDIEWIEAQYEEKHGRSHPSGWGQHLSGLGKLRLNKTGLAEFHTQNTDKPKCEDERKITEMNNSSSETNTQQLKPVDSLSKHFSRVKLKGAAPSKQDLKSLSKNCPLPEQSKHLDNHHDPHLADEDLHDLSPPPDLFPPEATWNISVTSVLHQEDAPGYSFFVQMLQEQNRAKLCQMNKDLNSWASFSTDLVREVVAGKLAAVRLGKLWYRVELLQNVVGESQVTGRLVDKGGLVTFPVGDLRDLPARFVSLPAQAVCVELAGLLGVFKAGVLASCLGRVRELLIGKKFSAVVENRACLGVPGTVPVLSITDRDMVDMEEGNINLAIMQLLRFASVQSITEKWSMLRSVRNQALLEILRRLLPPPSASAPAVGEQFVVQVLCAGSPENFVVQDVNTMEDLDRLGRDMDKFYSGRQEGWCMEDDSVKFLAVNCGSLGWRRAVVEEVKSETTVVRFLDYGGRKVLDTGHLASTLDTQFMKLTCQALSGRLGRVVGRLAGGHWGEGCKEWFERRVLDRQFTAVVMKRDTDSDGELVEVELVLCDQESLVEGKTVQDQMVGEGLAKYVHVAQ